MPGLPLPTIPQADVARHNTSESCYVVIGTCVYDVTSFLKAHPGGAELILEYAGRDVGEIMKQSEPHTHSKQAYRILQKKQVGFVATDPILKAVTESDDPASIVPLPPNKAGMKSLKATGVEQHLTGEGIQDQTEFMGAEDPNAAFMANTKSGGRKDFLDLDKPMLMQVWNGGFSKEFYLEQVHMATWYEKDGEPASAPLFGNALECLSLTPWWLVPLLWYPADAYLTYIAYQGLSVLETATYWFLGLFLWTLVEYGMHRGLFHVDQYLPDNRVGVTAHFLLHGIHHYLPMDKYRLVMPPALLALLTIPFWRLAHTVFPWDWYVATAVFCGGFFGYVCYDLTHYFLHHMNLPKYYQQLKTYHMAHHYEDSENGFGVTSRFWDKVFGTELMPGKAAKAA